MAVITKSNKNIEITKNIEVDNVQVEQVKAVINTSNPENANQQTSAVSTIINKLPAQQPAAEITHGIPHRKKSPHAGDGIISGVAIST